MFLRRCYLPSLRARPISISPDPTGFFQFRVSDIVIYSGRTSDPRPCVHDNEIMTRRRREIAEIGTRRGLGFWNEFFFFYFFVFFDRTFISRRRDGRAAVPIERRHGNRTVWAFFCTSAGFNLVFLVWPTYSSSFILPVPQIIASRVVRRSHAGFVIVR